MRYLSLLGLFLWCNVALAVDIFGMDYYLRDSFVRVIDDERGTSIVLSTDSFFEEPDSTVLNPIQYEALNKVADVVNRYSKIPISVTGHTDDVYSKDKRYQISQQHAIRVADFLVDAGVDPDRIEEVSGEADLFPIAPNDTIERRHLNRRVEITLLREDLRPKVRKREEKEIIEIEVIEKIEVKEKRRPSGKRYLEVEIEDPEIEIDEDFLSVIVDEYQKDR